MTNREKYITKRNEYDLMMSLVSHFICPIKAISEHKPPYQNCKGDEEECSKCIQKWLNQEADQPRPQWRDAMMKNFLRKE